MFFKKLLDKRLEDLQNYHLLEDEMSKYKTLNHESIKWDKVYEIAKELLGFECVDIRLCNYFNLACIHLNEERYFKELFELFSKLKNLLENKSELTSQKKKIKAMINVLIDEANKTKLNMNQKEFDILFSDLAELLECEFEKIQKNEVLDMSLSSNLSLNLNSNSSLNSNPNLNSSYNSSSSQAQFSKTLNDRQYKDFFQNLAFELLANDANNLNAYALFIEAMWGRIKSLPAHSNFITSLRHPSKDLIELLNESKKDEIEHIKCFMQHLILNPFWFDGMKMFCEFLKKQEKNSALALLFTLTNDFLAKFKELTQFSFEGNERICSEELLSYFSQEGIKQKKHKKDERKNLEQILFEIDNANYDNSLFHSVSSLLELAKAFEEKNMKKNAKLLYTHLVELMEKSLLKEYLKKEYENAKNKSKN